MRAEREAAIRVKTKRADQHINEFTAAFEVFTREHPYETYAEDDPETGNRDIKIRITDPYPVEWAAIVGDAIHNLRSALDHLVCHLIETNGNDITDQSGFPIVDAPEKLKPRLARQVKGAASGVAKVIQGLKPYLGGNDGYWMLHKIDIDDKHRLLVPVVGAYSAFGINAAAWANSILGPDEEPFPETLGPFYRPNGGPMGCPLKDGDTLMHIGPGAQSDVGPDLQFLIEPAFGEGSIAQCEPVLPTLTDLAGLVERTIQTLAPYLG